ncbi:inositol transporter 1-like [Stylonychia lemnae]|uniref:Hexose transporter 1 n=1 Tax=Stylonychia lemnae TaxID=5949 RepID=A0A078AIE4_STYLE|nr:inositol transporter 1-like [Stylonychia lemnae]|eukprot:CDW81272.1 inositol transporter 1-like [Stylonychia lemnae]
MHFSLKVGLEIKQQEAEEKKETTYNIGYTIVSLAQLGSAIGSLVAGPFADKYGRKITIIMADIFFTIGAVIMGVAPTIAILIVGRFLVGLGVGIAAMVVPVYLSEAAPTSIRGSLVTFNCLFITGGQFISYLICIALGNRWRWMLGLAATPAVIQLIGMLFMPETPVFLYKKGKKEIADKTLTRLYKPQYLEQKKMEVQKEVQSVLIESRDPFLTQIKALFTIYTRCIVLGAGLQFWQQFCGINTVMYFGPDILQKSGFGDESDPSSLLVASLPLAGMNALGTLIAIFYIDKLGRRYILIRMVPFIGFSLLIISLGLGLKGFGDELERDAGKWVSLTGILLYLAFFSISLGCTPWTINSEIYPLHLRGAGNSVSTTTNWVSNYLVSQFFLIVTKTTAGQVATFIAIALCCGFAWIFIYYLCPETKGKPIEQIVDELCPHAKNKSEEKQDLNSDQAHTQD